MDYELDEKELSRRLFRVRTIMILDFDNKYT
jgi:hypothetical protein